MISSTIPSSATSVALCRSSPSKQRWRLAASQTFQSHKHLCIGPGPYPHPHPHAFRKYVHTRHYRSRPSRLQAKVMIRQVICQGTQQVGQDTGSPPGGQPSPDAILLVPSGRFYFLLGQYSSSQLSFQLQPSGFASVNKPVPPCIITCHNHIMNVAIRCNYKGKYLVVLSLTVRFSSV